MRSGKHRRAEIKAARLRRAVTKAARLKADLAQKRLPSACVPVDPANLAPYNSYGEPDFVRRGYYEDISFQCVDCGTPGIWTAEQQKWWYEVAKGNVWSVAKRCRECRAKERQRREEARRIHFEGLQRSGRSLPRSHAPRHCR